MNANNQNALTSFTFPTATNQHAFNMQTSPSGQLVQLEFDEFDASVNGDKKVSPSTFKTKTAGSVTEDYLKRRTQNNIAVKKSREKSKQKGAMTMEVIEKLKEENANLEKKVEILTSELVVLKKVFMDHARGFSGGDSDLPDLEHLEKLLGHKLTEKVAVDEGSSSNLS